MFKFAIPKGKVELCLPNTAYHTYSTRNTQNLRTRVNKLAYYVHFNFFEKMIYYRVKIHKNI